MHGSWWVDPHAIVPKQVIYVTLSTFTTFCLCMRFSKVQPSIHDKARMWIYIKLVVPEIVEHTTKVACNNALVQQYFDDVCGIESRLAGA